MDSSSTECINTSQAGNWHAVERQTFKTGRELAPALLVQNPKAERDQSYRHYQGQSPSEISELR